MTVHYLEIVTPDVEGTCLTHSAALGVEFCEPVEELGQARLATLSDGTQIGVRAPMHDAEAAATRPYFLVEDIEAAVAAAEKAGALIAHPAMEIPGRGKFALYFLNKGEFGLWQL